MCRFAQVVVFCLFTGVLHAGTIVQTVTFHYATHGTTFTGYNQLNPSLAPLNDVIFNTHFDFAGGLVFSLLNTNSTTQTFNVTERTNVTTDGGGFLTNSAVESITLAPQETRFITPPSIVGNISTTQITSLSSFIGTSGLDPMLSLTGSVTPNIGGIRVTDVTNMFGTTLANGSETITYLFGTTVAVPEPASILTMLTGLVSVVLILVRLKYF